MGAKRDPWFIEASLYDSTAYGAFPKYEFSHEDKTPVGPSRLVPGPEPEPPRRARRRPAPGPAPAPRPDRRASGPTSTGSPRSSGSTPTAQGAISLLTDPRVRRALDLDRADPSTLDRYGRHSFGWSLLMARRLVEAGVAPGAGQPRQQRDLGHPRQRLPPPQGQPLPADRPGRLGAARRPARVGPARLDPDRDGRRVRPDAADLAAPRELQAPRPRPLGRRAVGVLRRGRRGRRAGRSARPTGSAASRPPTPRRPENLAATIYRALGIPPVAAWHDDLDRPHFVYHDDPIPGLG